MRTLGQYHKRGDLQKLRTYADDTIPGGYYEEIMQILNNDFKDYGKVPHMPESPQSIKGIADLWKGKDSNANG